MMRKHLARFVGKRMHFRATVMQYGAKEMQEGWRKTVCVGPVLDNVGRELADHVWLTVGPIFKRLQAKPGDVIEFDATVSQYWKGYASMSQRIDERETDYKLTLPANYVIVTRKGQTEQRNGTRETERVHGLSGQTLSGS